jgi:hypothetical protein
MLIVLDALGAPTREEYHKRIAQLPVVIKVTPTPTGTRRDYLVNGKLKESVFFGKDPVTSGDDSPSTGAGTDDPGFAEARSGPNAEEPNSMSFTLRDECGYTDDYGTWSGDCAAQEDIDDLYATMASLSDEVDGVQSDVASAEDDYCSRQIIPDPEDPTCSSDWIELSSLTGAAESDGIGGPFVASEALSTGTCPTGIANTRADPLDTRHAFGCGAEAVEEAAGLVGWVGAHVAASSVGARGALATASEVGWSVAGLIAGAFTFGFTSARYIQCLAT